MIDVADGQCWIVPQEVTNVDAYHMYSMLEMTNVVVMNVAINVSACSARYVKFEKRLDH